MTTRLLNDNPVAFSAALRRIRRRELAAARPPLFHRLFPSLVPAARRERTTRISPTEIVVTNPVHCI